MTWAPSPTPTEPRSCCAHARPVGGTAWALSDLLAIGGSFTASGSDAERDEANYPWPPCSPCHEDHGGVSSKDVRPSPRSRVLHRRPADALVVSSITTAPRRRPPDVVVVVVVASLPFQRARLRPAPLSWTCPRMLRRRPCGWVCNSLRSFHAASARPASSGATSAIGCTRRPSHRWCDGFTMVFRRPNGEIAWSCDVR